MGANIYDWDVVAANNATADTDLTWAEGQAPSTVNNSARVMMQRGKQLLIDLGGSLSAGGTANALTLTAQSPFTTLANGRIVTFRATATNTGAATINVNAAGAKAIVKMTSSGESALQGGEIQNTGIYELVYSAALAAGVGAWLLLGATSSGAPKGHLHGLTLSNNVTDATNDIDISAGECASDTDPFFKMVLAAALTKRLDAAWAVGSGNGGRMSAAALANGTYHVWAIQRSDTGVVDGGFDVSATAPTMPANYDRKRRIGSILRESGAIVAFRQIGDVFKRNGTTFTAISGTAAYGALLTYMGVPTGIVVEPLFSTRFQVSANSTGGVLVGDGGLGGLDTGVVGASAGTPVGSVSRGDTFTSGGIFTDTSGQIYTSMALAGTCTLFDIKSNGWIDTRGRI